MFTVIDLFAGAGGLSLGFQQEGDFKIVGVIENNRNALATYLNNHTKSSIKVDTDIRKIDFNKYKEKIGNVDVVIGGPPCQGFSNANRQKTKFISMNNALVKKYADAILTLKPKVFVMENVAMLTSDVHKFFDSCVDHDEVIKIGVEMKPESYVIMNHNPDGMDMIDLLSSEEKIKIYSLDDTTFNLIKLINRYKGKTEKLAKYFVKYSKTIESSLEIYKHRIENDTVGEIISGYVDTLLNIYRTKVLKNDDLFTINNFVEFIRAVSLMTELYNNAVIFKLESETSGKITAKINTYSVFDYLIKRFGREYIIDHKILNAYDYGAPQERRRFIMIGINRLFKPNAKIEFPAPIDYKHTVRDAIEDLEEIEPSKSITDEPIKRHDFSKNEFTKALQDCQQNIYNHINTDTRSIALERFKNIPQGKNFHSLSSELKINTYSDPSRTQNTIYLRLSYDEACGTVVNVRKSMWIHPVKNRAISIREAARLQTFPDSYIFYGSKDSQYQQVGNAVPPMLAKSIAHEIKKILEV